MQNFGELRSILHSGRHQSEKDVVVKPSIVGMCADHEALLNKNRLEGRIVKFLKKAFPKGDTPVEMLNYIKQFTRTHALSFHAPFDMPFECLYGRESRLDFKYIVNGFNFFIGYKTTNSMFMSNTAAVDNFDTQVEAPPCWLMTYRKDMLLDALNASDTLKFPSLDFFEISNELLCEESGFFEELHQSSVYLNRIFDGIQLNKLNHNVCINVSRHYQNSQDKIIPLEARKPLQHVRWAKNIYTNANKIDGFILEPSASTADIAITSNASDNEYDLVLFFKRRVPISLERLIRRSSVAAIKTLEMKIDCGERGGAIVHQVLTARDQLNMVDPRRSREIILNIDNDTVGKAFNDLNSPIAAGCNFLLRTPPDNAVALRVGGSAH